jgi:tripartite-type tricarboxylate transporter receptor subunit TctC
LIALKESSFEFLETGRSYAFDLAADAVAKSAPDGYTLLVSFTSHTINATLYPKLPFDPVTDFTPISMIATSSS